MQLGSSNDNQMADPLTLKDVRRFMHRIESFEMEKPEPVIVPARPRTRLSSIVIGWIRRIVS